MDSVKVDWGLLSRVSPFRYPRINRYLLLPVAFRSLSRLSSALSAKASTLRSYSLNLFGSRFVCLAWHTFNCFSVLTNYFCLLFDVFSFLFDSQYSIFKEQLVISSITLATQRPDSSEANGFGYSTWIHNSLRELFHHGLRPINLLNLCRLHVNMRARL